MGDQVVAMEVVLPDGRIITTRSVPNYSSGPNLNHLFIGSEGVFGVITRATIKVFRQPESQVFAAMDFESFEQGFRASAELHALGIRPTLLDLTEEENRIRLYLLFEGFREGVTAREKRARQVCSEFGGQDLGPEPTLNYWADRHESAENYKRTALGKSRKERWNRRRARGFDYLHLGLPISQVLEYRRQAEKILSYYRVRVVEYAIWSRPELFSMMVVPEEGGHADFQTGYPADFRENLGNAVERVLTLAQDMGGVMEYCHGVGIKLNHLLSREMAWATMLSGSGSRPWTRPIFSIPANWACSRAFPEPANRSRCAHLLAAGCRLSPSRSVGPLFLLSLEAKANPGRKHRGLDKSPSPPFSKGDIGGFLSYKDSLIISGLPDSFSNNLCVRCEAGCHLVL